MKLYTLSAKPYQEEYELLLEDLLEQNHIVLYNDDVNTFDWVIECLVQICKHDLVQAEQCAHIIHFNGKCSIKEGSYTQLEPICTALLDRGLSAVIE